MDKNVCITIHGKVQGVFFRASAKKMADELGITGYVKNNDDGTVTIEASGSSERIEQMVSWCREGSRAADVHHVDVVAYPVSQHRDDFMIIQ